MESLRGSQPRPECSAGWSISGLFSRSLEGIPPGCGPLSTVAPQGHVPGGAGDGLGPDSETPGNPTHQCWRPLVGRRIK